MFLSAWQDHTKICVSCFRAVKIWFVEYNSLILTTGCSTWHLMANNSEDLRIRIVALHKDGLGNKKFGNSLELSYSTVARVIQRFSKTGFTRNRPRKGRSKKLSPCAVRQVQKLASRNRRMSAASIALEVAEVEGQLFNAQTIRHTLQQVGLHGRRPRRKPLLKLAHKKACKQFAEDNLAKSMNYWNHVLWSDESKVNLFDSDGVQHVWRCPGEEYQENCALPTVKHGGGSIMVWGCMTILLVLESCGSLRETWILTCTVTFWSRRWCPPFRNCFQHNNHPKHTAKMTTALLLKVKVMEWPSMSLDLNPIEHMWGILKRKVEKHHVSNIQQLRDVIMEEWKRMPATTCAALVNFMPRRIKAVLDNNGAPTKYLHFGQYFHVLTCSLRVYSFLLPVIWKIMVICWVIFRGQ